MTLTSKVQQRIDPLPNLRRRWFSNRIKCIDEGWLVSLTSSGGSRVDAYRYEENGRVLTLSGEGGGGGADVVIPNEICWDDAPAAPVDEATKRRILFNVTAALQHFGWSVIFHFEK